MHKFKKLIYLSYSSSVGMRLKYDRWRNEKKYGQEIGQCLCDKICDLFSEDPCVKSSAKSTTLEEEKNVMKLFFKKEIRFIFYSKIHTRVVKIKIYRVISLKSACAAIFFNSIHLIYICFITIDWINK